MTSIFRHDPARPVLVVGGRGFVGSHIVRALLDEGIGVHLFGPPMRDDLLSDLAGRFGETEGSVEDEAGLEEAMARSGAGAVVTTAAYASGDQGLMRGGDADAGKAMAINVEGMRKTFEAARRQGIGRVVWADSTTVYGEASLYGKERVDEGDARRPTTFYGLTKVLGEDVAQYYRDRYGMEIVGLRMSLLLGPGLWYQGAASAIAGVMRNAAAGSTHRVSFHSEAIDLMHVRDVAQATLLALRSADAPAAVYNINGFTASLPEIIAAVEAAVPGYRVEHEPVEPVRTFPLVDDRRARIDLGYRPRFGLKDIVAELTAKGDRN